MFFMDFLFQDVASLLANECKSVERDTMSSCGTMEPKQFSITLTEVVVAVMYIIYLSS